MTLTSRRKKLIILNSLLCNDVNRQCKHRWNVVTPGLCNHINTRFLRKVDIQQWSDDMINLETEVKGKTKETQFTYASDTHIQSATILASTPQACAVPLFWEMLLAQVQNLLKCLKNRSFWSTLSTTRLSTAQAQLPDKMQAVVHARLHK